MDGVELFGVGSDRHYAATTVCLKRESIMNIDYRPRLDAPQIRIRAITSRFLFLVFATLVAAFVSIRLIADPRVFGSGAVIPRQERLSPAGLSEQVTVRAAGRGNPWISLADGHSLRGSYVGEQRLVETLMRNQAKPLSLTSADLDEDGVPDLIAGYRAQTGEGIVVIHRGNVDSIYPNSFEAEQRKANGEYTDAPFLSPASVYSVPAGAAFIGAGDFDGDHHVDVVAADRGGRYLHFLSGDGHGGLSLSQLVASEGSVTALSVGEINARDGIEDIIVGVNGEAGPKALIFEGPQGAMNATPDEIDLPGAASSFALADLDDEYGVDLAIAAEHHLVIVHGSNRNLNPNAEPQPVVSGAIVEMRTFSDEIRSVAAGRFTDAGFDELGVLFNSGRVDVLNSSPSRLKTVVNDQALDASLKSIAAQDSARSRRGRSAASASADVSAAASSREGICPIGSWDARTLTSGSESSTARLFRVRLSSSPLDNLLVACDCSPDAKVIMVGPKERKGLTGLKTTDIKDGTVEATLTLGGGAVAVLPMRLNKDALTDLVLLKAGDATPNVIMTVPQSIFVVTNTNDSGAGSLRDQITLANNASGADEIRFSIPGLGVRSIALASALPAITGALTIDGYSQSGSAVNNSSVGDNAIPLIELNGLSAGAANGLDITAGNCLVRGLIINRFTQAGIRLSGNGSNLVQGNFIGVNSNGTVKQPNQTDGVSVTSANNTIGGTSLSFRNLVSGNGGNGILLAGASSSGNTIQGNLLGTTASGIGVLGNAANGVLLQTAPNALIGGTPVTRNIIAGNTGNGIELSPTSSSMIQFNNIGTDINAAFNLGNIKDGIRINRSSTNAVVKDVVVAFNRGAGILKSNFATATLRPNVQLFANIQGGIVFPLENPCLPPAICLIDAGCLIQPGFGINSSSISGNTLTIRGYLFAANRPRKAITIDLYTGPLNAPGDQSFGAIPFPLGNVTVNTDDSGLGAFDRAFTLPTGSSGHYVNAQATADTGTFNNSNFLPFNTGCSYSLIGNQTAIVPAAGGTGSFQIVAGNGCKWSVLFDACSVSLNSPSTGSGSTTMNFTVLRNDLAVSRQLMFVVQGQTFTMTQGGSTVNPGGCTPTQISIGQTVSNASISSADCDSPRFGGHKADLYSFNALAGQVLVIEMNRISNIDPFLILVGPSGNILDVNDDIVLGDEINSRIVYQVATSGLYTIEATTYEASDRGFYVLSLRESVCTVNSINFGQQITADISDFDCNDSAGYKADLYRFTANAGQTITVTMNRLSSTIDPVLLLFGPNGNLLTFDDDSNGQPNAKMVYMITSTGEYVIEASTYDRSDRGLYVLTLNQNDSFAPCTYALSPQSASVAAASGSGSFGVTTRSDCPWTAVSNSPWLTSSSSGTGNGTVNYFFQQNAGTASRFGTITVGTATFGVTQAGTPAGPTITSACKGDGKQLIVNGSGFVAGARVILNGEEEKTLFVSSTQIIAKKAGKRAATGDTLQVRNPDATQTQVFSYTKNSCFVQ
jgi:hypothetical protein